MRKVTTFFALLILFIPESKGQSVVSEQKSQVIVEQRKIELNGGLRSQVGGKSRTYIKIDLPENTKEWYYSFTTTAGESGAQNLNLALQVSSLLMDPTGATGSILKSIKVPAGTSSADIYLCDRRNIELFNSKADLNGSTYHYMMEGSVQNTSQAVVRVDDVKKGTWFLGLKNPSSLDAINIFIEIVAIVEEKIVVQKTAEQEKAELYGTMAWKAYERGEYDKCLQLSEEAIKINSELGWVHNNIGLVKLIKGDFISAIDSYAKAITIFKKEQNPKMWFEGAIKDLNSLLAKHGSIEGAADILENLKTEYRKY